MNNQLTDQVIDHSGDMCTDKVVEVERVEKALELIRELRDAFLSK